MRRETVGPDSNGCRGMPSLAENASDVLGTTRLRHEAFSE
jgi:hypothetical protein